MKKSKYIILAALLLSASQALHAQSGCGDSPENPTAVLGILGAAGASLVWVRDRYLAHRNGRRK